MSFFEDIETRLERITGLLGRLNRELGQLGSSPLFVTKKDLNELKIAIMSQFSEFATRVTAQVDELATSVDTVLPIATNIQADIVWLKQQIEKLQSIHGTWTAEEQALADGIEAKLGSMLPKQKGVVDTLTAMDAATEVIPEPPVEPTA